jgi:lipopolysaccharide transport system ATP-binding protein
MRPVIRAEGVSKRFRIGARQAAYSTLRESLTDAVRAPFRRRAAQGDGDDTIWALRDVGFEVEAGEAVALIGRNGAGKSTLLKILSRITEPTAGRVELYGRVGSLLEVGTGFHSELTGRENIFLSGALLGMRGEEIRRQFDDIVSFAEVEKFIDTPVKRYSSGMYMRLAFAVAAHLDPEILLVDEVLAVGDANFQKKCLGKMNEVAHHGRTILFVSHNMTAVSQLCPRAILLADGRVVRDGPTPEVVAEYLKVGSRGAGECVWEDPRRAPGNDKARLRAVRVVSGGAVAAEVDIDKETEVEVEFENYVEGARNLCAHIQLLDGAGTTVLSTAAMPGANAVAEEWFGRPHPAGLYRARCTLPANFLNQGRYYISVFVLSTGPTVVEAQAAQALSFKVFDTGAMRAPGSWGHWPGVVRVPLPWRTEFVRPPGRADDDEGA